MTLLDAARALGADGGIETLVVFLGVQQRARRGHRPQGRLERRRLPRPGAPRSAYTVWRPSHFAAEFAELEAQVRADRRAARDLGDGPARDDRADRPRRRAQAGVAGSRYFPYYTRPWIDDDALRSAATTRTSRARRRAPSTTRSTPTTTRSRPPSSARATPAATGTCSTIAGVLDRLAHRRFIEDRTSARPDVVDAVPAAAGAARAAPGARLALPDRRRRRADGRAAVCSRSTACTRRRSATG